MGLCLRWTFQPLDAFVSVFRSRRLHRFYVMVTMPAVILTSCDWSFEQSLGAYADTKRAPQKAAVSRESLAHFHRCTLVPAASIEHIEGPQDHISVLLGHNIDRISLD